MKRNIVLLMIFALISLTACQQQAAKSETPSEIKQISVEQTKIIVEKDDVQFIDVRMDSEFKGGHAPKAVNMPLDSLEQTLAQLDKSKPVYLICQTGRRSQIGAEILQKNGFKTIFNVEGGTSAWRNAGLPIEK